LNLLELEDKLEADEQTRQHLQLRGVFAAHDVDRDLYLSRGEHAQEWMLAEWMDNIDG
jgi:hypothetical protein